VDQQRRRCCVFKHAQGVKVVEDDDSGFVVVSDVGDYVLGKDRVITGVVAAYDRLDQPVVTVQAVGHHGDRAAFGDIVQISPGDVDVIAAQTTDDFDLHVLVRAFDKERIVALQRVHHQLFKPYEADKQTATVDTVLGDDVVVAKFAAHDGQRVKTVTAVDAHRGVDVIADEIGTLTAIDVGIGRSRIIRVYPHERPNKEAVIVFVTEQEQFGLVGINGKVILPGAAIKRRVLADTIRQEAQGDLRGGIIIVTIDQTVIGVRCITRRGKQLPDLECVVACIAEHIEGRKRIVKDEDIVTVAAIDLNVALEGTVVFNPLEDPGDLIPVFIQLQRGHHTQGDGGVEVGAEQEQVSAVGAIDFGPVGALTCQTAVPNTDQSGTLTR